jgi:CheY-like chemotaxis protein
VSPVSALVVEPDEADRLFFASALTSAGVAVIETDNFRTAWACLETQAPPLLITEFQLGTDNGLRLALLGRTMSPQMSLVLTSRCRDWALQRCAEALGAVVVQKPMTETEFFSTLIVAAAIPTVRGRRCKGRRRDIASFLLLEALGGQVPPRHSS